MNLNRLKQIFTPTNKLIKPLLLIAVLIGFSVYCYNYILIPDLSIQSRAEKSVIEYFKIDTIKNNIKIQYAEVRPTMLKFSKTRLSDSLFAKRDSLQEKKMSNLRKISNIILDYKVDDVMHKKGMDSIIKLDSVEYYESKIKEVMNNINRLDLLIDPLPGYEMEILLTINDEMNAVWVIYFDQNFKVTAREMKQYNFEQ